MRTINEEIMKNNEMTWDKIKELKVKVKSPRNEPYSATLDIFDMRSTSSDSSKSCTKSSPSQKKLQTK